MTMSTGPTGSITPTSGGTFTVVVKRQIKPGREAEYVQAMRGFVDYALRCSGYLSLSILSPAPGQRDYTVIGKFADEAARRQFTSSTEYSSWMTRLGEFTEGSPGFTESSVLDEWVRTAATASSSPTPPRWKTAVATFTGVWPVVALLTLFVAPSLASWPFLLRSALIAALTVTLLTWAVMPTVSHILRPWLYPALPPAVPSTSIPPAQS